MTDSEAGGTVAWKRRRILSGGLRAALTLAPIACSFAFGMAGNVVVPRPESLLLGVGRWLAILAAAMVVLALVDCLARRLLPLATLLQLSLVFPDHTPDRFKLALKAGSGRSLARAVAEAREQGLSDEPTLAAEQLVVLAAAIGDHDRRTRGHSERVRLYAELIGEEMGLDEDELGKLQWAALIHDLGKVTVPPEILNKKGRPDEREWAILQRHPEAGEELARPAEAWLGEWIDAIGGHHERWDGTGYPRKLKGEEIPRAAAIVALADSFEVMTAVRSYKKAMPLSEARKEMTRCAGTHFSPEVVRAFLHVSIGSLRRAMGPWAALVHVPLLGRVSSAASYAPDTVAAAVGFTTSAATTGAGAVAVSAAIALSAGPAVPASAPPVAPSQQQVAIALASGSRPDTPARPHVAAAPAAPANVAVATPAPAAAPAPAGRAGTSVKEAPVGREPRPVPRDASGSERASGSPTSPPPASAPPAAPVSSWTPVTAPGTTTTTTAPGTTTASRTTTSTTVRTEPSVTVEEPVSTTVEPAPAPAPAPVPDDPKANGGGPKTETPGNGGGGGPKTETPGNGGGGPKTDARGNGGGPKDESPGDGGGGPKTETPGNGGGAKADSPGGGGPKADSPGGGGPKADSPAGKGPKGK